MLFIILAFRTSIDSPNPIFRLVYIIAFFVPIVFKYKTLFLPALLLFMTVGIYGFAYNFFPYNMEYYMMIAFLCLGLSNKGIDVKISSFWLLTFLYVLFIDVLRSGEICDITYSALTVSIGVLLVKDTHRNDLRKLMLISFTIISFTLSLLYLLNYESFLETYNAKDNMERSGWTDPNYLSCIIGMGLMSAIVLLIQIVKNNIYRICCIVVICISFITQLLLASRGGILCVAISIIPLLLFSKIKASSKILLLLFVIGFLIWLYLNSYFELLLYRIAADQDGGSGRLAIWSSKLSSFINECSVFDWLFGLGNRQAFNLASNNNGIGFHNDFIAILCSYGIVGFSIFIYTLFILPFKFVDKNSRSIIMSCVLYLIIAGMTLEPITAGRITYYGFYALILLFTRDRVYS